LYSSGNCTIRFTVTVTVRVFLNLDGERFGMDLSAPRNSKKGGRC
jgi:hypothetical protein